MSKKQSTKKTSKKTFSYTPTQKLPTLKANKTDWDLKRLYYKSHKDPQIETDLAAGEHEYAAFVKKYQNKDFVSSVPKLLAALEDYKHLHTLVPDKPAYYLSLRRELNSTDTDAEKILNIIEQRLTKLGNSIIFFPLTIGKIPKLQQSIFLNNERLAEYKFLLEGMFADAAYSLTEAEEKILSLKAITSRGLWIAGTEKIVGSSTITVKGKKMPLNEALMKHIDAPKKERHLLWNACADELEKIAPVAENELNALFIDKKINDELRNYQKPYSATVRAYDNQEKSLEALVEAVTTTGYALSKKFFTLKKKLMGSTLDFIDRNDMPGLLPELEYDTAVTICRDAFYGFNPLYGSIFDEMLSNGHIDVFSKPGKGGGAFCAGGTNMPTVVLLNHSNDFNSARTLAHEIGHAIHSYRSKEQSVLYSEHSTVTAETASTFFEAVIGHSILQTLSEKDKVQYLGTLLGDKIDTIIMCIARYCAELEMHETVRREGSMTWQNMSAVLAKHLKNYCGKAITVNDRHGLLVISKTHYRRNFYQYTYSFGSIASSIMYKRYQENPNYAAQVETFLSAGEKDTVENIFGEIGIDTTTPSVFVEGLQMLNEEITTLEKLLKKV